MKKPAKKQEFMPVKRRADLTPGQTLRTVRELQGMSQTDLSRASGIPQPTVSAMERDRESIGIERAKKLARALRVHPAVIVFADWHLEGEADDRPVIVGRRVRAHEVA
jgi:transcriptional regulator with XRE-family HTH domain